MSPIKYSSSTIFITQNQETNSSSLSGVASLVGINLGSSSFGGEIPSSMYPQIGNSPKFKRLILNKVIDQKQFDIKKILIDYYDLNDENETQNSSELFVSKLEEDCYKKLSEIISISVNQKDGFITINSTMPVAEFSAKVAKESREILQTIIIENKIETARQNLNFSENI